MSDLLFKQERNTIIKALIIIILGLLIYCNIGDWENNIEIVLNVKKAIKMLGVILLAFFVWDLFGEVK